uniref:NADH dehydrogenase subunit 6 n=1 Tax=Cheumatopsyche brevilineata TaxID=1437087 RepID=UPI002237F7CA|nr:NADH dehydrogenase subunit 6 [Cheumatopsyche brevilineata]UYO79211.1 NADH dehydrogenase subunit 6 [Cheumatopsyche brevilineata]
MMKFILMNTIFMISLVLTVIKTPLSLGLLILIQTLIFSLILNINSNIYWMSYILYLIMLGGLLILFIYMCSIASNETIKININLTLFFTFMYFLMFSIYFYMNFFWMNLMTSKMTMMIFMNKEVMLNISKIYNNFTMMITILLILYLLISLVMVSMFTNNDQGPLRAIK